jgi:hypothetical protein
MHNDFDRTALLRKVKLLRKTRHAHILRGYFSLIKNISQFYVNVNGCTRKHTCVQNSVNSLQEAYNLFNENMTSRPMSVIIIGYVRRTSEESDHVMSSL